MKIKLNIYTLIGFVNLILISSVIIFAVSNKSKIAYIETSRLTIGFAEAAKVENELKAENEKWLKQLKMLEDSAKAFIDLMTKEYNTSSSTHKKELEDKLALANQRVNNFKQANLKRMADLRKEKMSSVLNKANVFIKEYGKKHNYSIIFATTPNGNIVYGDENSFDITDDVIKGLNERYK